MFFKPPKTFALVLNFSLRTINGQRLSDKLKEELVDFVNRFEDEDMFYLSSSTARTYSRDDLVESNGKRTAVIGNWRPQELPPSLSAELPKALQAISAHGDMDGEWYLCFVTDRFRNNDEKHLSQMLDLNHMVWGEAKVMVVTVGDHYDFSEYRNICKDYDCKYIHLSNPTGLSVVLSEWTGMEES